MAWTSPCPEVLAAEIQTQTDDTTSLTQLETELETAWRSISALTQQPTDLHNIWITVAIAVAYLEAPRTTVPLR